MSVLGRPYSGAGGIVRAAALIVKVKGYSLWFVRATFMCAALAFPVVPALQPLQVYLPITVKLVLLYLPCQAMLCEV